MFPQALYSRDPYIIHLNIATCKWWFPFLLVAKATCFKWWQHGDLLRSPLLVRGLFLLGFASLAAVAPCCGGWRRSPHWPGMEANQPRPTHVTSLFRIWLWLSKIGSQHGTLVKWKHGPKPVVRWWFNFDPHPYDLTTNGLQANERTTVQISTNLSYPFSNMYSSPLLTRQLIELCIEVSQRGALKCPKI